jgi:hypothetical protein
MVEYVPPRLYPRLDGIGWLQLRKGLLALVGTSVILVVGSGRSFSVLAVRVGTIVGRLVS